MKKTYIGWREADYKSKQTEYTEPTQMLAEDGTLLVTSVIDNLLKGASGQAVQNMNLMFGLPEKTGLQLKASAF